LQEVTARKIKVRMKSYDVALVAMVIEVRVNRSAANDSWNNR